MTFGSFKHPRLVGCVLALIGAGCHAAHPSDGALVPVPVPVPVRGPTWLEGPGASYAFQLKNVAQVATSSPAAFAFSGELSVSPHRSSVAGAVELGLSVRNVVPVEPDPARRDELLKIASAMKQPISVRLEDGKITSLGVVPDADTEAVNLVRVLASAFQFASSAPGQVQDWSASEFDSTGKYQASYKRLAPNRFEKRKQRYEALTFGKLAMGPFGTPLVPDVKSALSTVELSPFSFVSAVSDEELGMSMGPGNETTSRTHVELHRIATSPSASIDWPAFEAAAKHYGMSEPLPRAKPDLAAFDRERIGTFTYQTALAQLERVERDRVAHPDASDDDKLRAAGDSQRAFNALAGLFRQRPAVISQAERDVLLGSVATEPIVGALGNADTDATQAALVRLIENRQLTVPVRVSTLRSLVRIQIATEATVDFLMRAATQPALFDVATFGLGSISRRLAENGYRERSARVGQWLIGALQRATSPEEQLRVLGGISNSGFEPALSALASSLRSADPRVRAAAIEATRLMPTSEADAVIASALKDPITEVKMAALNASKARQPAPALVEGVEAILLSDERASVRERAIRIAGDWQQQQPSLHSALTRLAGADTDDGVRSAARTALGDAAKKDDNPG